MKTKQIRSWISSWLLVAVLFAVCGGMVLPGCRVSRQGADALQTVMACGVLRVGTTGDYCPMSYLNPETHAYEGFDAALAEDLAASLGVELEYVPTTWPTLMRDTLDRKFDLALCGITITDARKRQALMSDGYLGNGKTILCRSEDAGKYTSLDAVNRPEVRVMVNPGGLNEQFAGTHLPRASLSIHPVNEEIPALVASGKADVMVTEIMEAAYYCGKDATLAAPLLDRPFTNGELGILLPPGNETLLEHVNGFLEKERRSGRLDELGSLYLHIGVPPPAAPGTQEGNSTPVRREP
ncbi:MAG: transporter substrate-binding domain-containing protein [Lentisphaeria bacterium]|nr:transporter substrate-binding domain-containing protein [Lentisphaeria bacterium]MBR3506577.1 transporter substrate-binding domain-containing protein [Lentisphaeria bacterium]